MKCEVCGNGIDKGPLYRVNELGVEGVWRHEGCMSADQVGGIDPQVAEITRLVDNDSRRGKP